MRIILHDAKQGSVRHDLVGHTGPVLNCSWCKCSTRVRPLASPAREIPNGGIRSSSMLHTALSGLFGHTACLNWRNQQQSRYKHGKLCQVLNPNPYYIIDSSIQIRISIPDQLAKT